MNKIGFIGLGVMGAPMAGHLSKNNFKFQYLIEVPKNLSTGNQNIRAKFANLFLI